ncbi:MAG TPA: DUF3786 domain-containing protein, partial [bacterium]|nr:DUF3786 domain-containing protein [bacterium]
YLLQARDIFLQDKWISERDIPGGSLFFQGPHRLPDNILCTRFGNDLSAFTQACQSLGGLPLAFGDSSFVLQVLPRIKLGCVLWTADDEFPARFSYLFTPCIQQHLPLDVIFALANVVTDGLLQQTPHR